MIMNPYLEDQKLPLSTIQMSLVIDPLTNKRQNCRTLGRRRDDQVIDVHPLQLDVASLSLWDGHS